MDGCAGGGSFGRSFPGSIQACPAVGGNAEDNLRKTACRGCREGRGCGRRGLVPHRCSVGHRGDRFWSRGHGRATWQWCSLLQWSSARRPPNVRESTGHEVGHPAPGVLSGYAVSPPWTIGPCLPRGGRRGGALAGWLVTVSRRGGHGFFLLALLCRPDRSHGVGVAHI